MVRLALAGVVIACIAGCGGSKGQAALASRSEPAGSGSTSTAARTSTAAAEPTAAEIGTLTISGSGTTVEEDVSMGRLGYGADAGPPQDVLDSWNNQNLAVPSVVARSAFVYGQLVLHYTEGSLPIAVTFSDSDVIGNLSGGFPPNAAAIFQINGQWTSGGADGEPVGFTMQPRQSVSLPVWIQFPQVRSNAEPTMKQSLLNTMTFELVPAIDQVGSSPDVTISGPKAADCDGDGELLPFAELPFSHAGNDYGVVKDESVSCSPL